MAFTDVELLARLIQCEAGGEGLQGMQAVASVIMNRVNVTVGEYARVSDGGSIRNIILQPGQFACAQTEWKGVPNQQNLYNMSPEPIHFEIAQWAIDGNRITDLGEALWFFAPYGKPCCLNFPNQNGVFVAQINGHCFYIPTDLYADT
jgi:N-acetylmuramoyl-L-alanine amidase